MVLFAPNLNAFKMSLAICFNLDQSEFLSSDNGLRNDTVLCTLVITCFPHRKCITFSNLGALADESFILAQKMTFVVESIENLYRNSKVLFFFFFFFFFSYLHNGFKTFLRHPGGRKRHHIPNFCTI